MSPTKWGIVSTGRISSDFVSALGVLDNHVVVAVAGRDLESAMRFAEMHDIPKAYGSYSELSQDPDADIIYIGVINTHHYKLCIMMLRAGKHVLCEKPLAINLNQAREIIDCAHQVGVFLMEAIWSRFFPVYTRLRKAIDTEAIGVIKHLNVMFGFPLSHIERVNVKMLGGGGILDIGIYALQLAQFVFKGKPTMVSAGGFLNSFKVDNYANCILEYPGEKIANLTINTTVEMSNEAVIVGTKGIIRIPNFWAPNEIIINGEHIKYDLPESSQEFNFINSVGLSYEAEQCRHCLHDKLKQCPTLTHNDTLQLAELMDAWRMQIGVTYDEDIIP